VFPEDGSGVLQAEIEDTRIKPGMRRMGRIKRFSGIGAPAINSA
jgi:hypothetical protein